MKVEETRKWYRDRDTSRQVRRREYIDISDIDYVSVLRHHLLPCTADALQATLAP